MVRSIGRARTTLHSSARARADRQSGRHYVQLGRRQSAFRSAGPVFRSWSLQVVPIMVPPTDGKLTLVAVEYITEKGPAALGSQLFSFSNAPNRYGLPAFYELHVWAWRANPTGAFADMNPVVSCDAAPLPN